MTQTELVNLEAWIRNNGDGSCSICWFLQGHGPDENDYEDFALDNTGGEIVTVLAGSPQHREALSNLKNED